MEGSKNFFQTNDYFLLDAGLRMDWPEGSLGTCLLPEQVTRFFLNQQICKRNNDWRQMMRAETKNERACVRRFWILWWFAEIQQ